MDGAHIYHASSHSFYRFMPELIFEGHVYIAMPPLYKAMPSKGNEEYLYDDKALSVTGNAIKARFTLQRYKGLWGNGCPAALGNNAESGNPNAQAGGNRRCQNGIGSYEMLMGTDVPPRKHLFTNTPRMRSLVCNRIVMAWNVLSPCIQERMQ